MVQKTWKEYIITPDINEVVLSSDNYDGSVNFIKIFEVKITLDVINKVTSKWDLFQPKTVTFSTLTLILVHFKTVHYFSQPSFSLLSYLKNS